MDGGTDTSTLNMKHIPKKSSSLSLESPPKVDYPPQSDFVEYIRSLFDIFDTEKKGYVTIDELVRHLNETEDLNLANSGSKNHALIHALQQVCPANGYINFKRFDLAIQIALGKRNVGREKGIGRSLRPRSFLFAVTEASSGEDAGIKEDSRHGLQKIISSSPADSVISSDMDESSETADILLKEFLVADHAEIPPKESYQQKRDRRSKVKTVESTRGRMAIEEFFVLQKCLLETNKVREIYRSRIAELEEAIEEDTHIAISSTFDYNHAALHISKILRMNEKLQLLQVPNPTSLTTEDIGDFSEPHKKIEELNFCISQLENEKSVLVKDYFSLKARFAELDGKQQENILF